MKGFFKILFALFILFVLSFFIFYSFYTITKNISGISMYPTLKPDDKVHMTPFFSTVNRHDIVAVNPNTFTYKGINKSHYIKRIIGMPNDVLVFYKPDGRLLSINGETQAYVESDTSNTMLYKSNFLFPVQPKNLNYSVFTLDKQKNYIENHITKQLTQFEFLESLNVQQDKIVVKVPNKHYFVMSDNRILGRDSRHYGFIPKKGVVHLYKGFDESNRKKLHIPNKDFSQFYPL